MMKKLLLIVVIVVLLILGGVTLLMRNSSSTNHSISTITANTSPTSTILTSNTPSQTGECQTSQLTGIISTQGAAGSTYGNLELTNSGSSNCQITLGNTITASFDASNIQVQYQKNNESQSSTLNAGAKVYSQIHYPNGAQCQNGFSEKEVTFFYKTAQTSVTFKQTNVSGVKLMVPSCNNLSEKTIIGIWPLSKTQITQ